MEDFKDLIPKRKKVFIFILLFISLSLIGAGAYFYYYYYYLDEQVIEEESIEKEEITQETKQKYMIDIKGEIKKPGVYLLEENKRVIDAIKEAGGLTSDADTSVNNLSMKIKDEMVIIIYSKTEINNFLETKNKEADKLEKCTDQIINDSCITKDDISNNVKEETNNKTKDSTNKKVSLNTATKEEIMTLSGIGESKAEKIIEYRKTNKFESIEDIKKISGIGDSIFEKIKDNITT